MEMKTFDEKISEVAQLIMESKKVVIFTGAGVSTESGIPDFRSPGGIWSRFDPDDFTIDKFLYSAENRDRQWKFLVSNGLFNQARPNNAHKMIAWLETIGKVQCVITQNVDDLHQKGGSNPQNVYELHGNMKWMKCLSCGERYDMDDLFLRYGSQPHAPVCEQCRGILKAEVIFFGEALPEKTLTAAAYHASTCDLLIVIGSSLVVYPAAYMPKYAKDGGARVVIINNEKTPYDDHADIIVRSTAGNAMTRLAEEVKKRLS
ncbi:MAG: Sir2 family NAD-dependent protein deacetylase [Syntrophales bacterium]|nr:Sir2 family NAD-dependent protein deacetylase [Syntrophales bacterium]